MADTEFGTRAEEFTQAVGNGPPYVVRYHWAGGTDQREREVVTGAIAACLGVKTLEREQVITDSDRDAGPLADRIKYLFWLLKAFDLSLGFTHGWEDTSLSTDAAHSPSLGRVYRFTMRVDRSRARGYVEDD